MKIKLGMVYRPGRGLIETGGEKVVAAAVTAVPKLVTSHVTPVTKMPVNNVTPKKGRGRPKVHANATERQRACRARKKVAL